MYLLLAEVGPKKILDLMNVPGLTRENVASHLQKYRLYLSRLQKQNGGRSFGGITLPDVTSKNPPVNYTHQNSISVQQNTATSRYTCGTQKHNAQGSTPNHVDYIKNIVSLQVPDSKEAVTSVVTLESQKGSSVSQLGVVLSFKGMALDAEHKTFEAPASKHQLWSGGIPLMQFMQYPKHDHEPYGLLEDYSLPPVDHFHTPLSVSSKIHNTYKHKTGIPKIKPDFMDSRSNHRKIVTPVATMIDSVSVQVDRRVLDLRDLGPSQGITRPATPNINKYCSDQTSNDLVPELSSKVATELAPFPEDLSFFSPQWIGCLENICLNGMEFFQYSDSASTAGIYDDSYNGLESNYEYLYDSVLEE